MRRTRYELGPQRGAFSALVFRSPAPPGPCPTQNPVVAAPHRSRPRVSPRVILAASYSKKSVAACSD